MGGVAIFAHFLPRDTIVASVESVIFLRACSDADGLRLLFGAVLKGRAMSDPSAWGMALAAGVLLQ